MFRIMFNPDPESGFFEKVETMKTSFGIRYVSPNPAHYPTVTKGWV